jgi:hypothetical protein
VKKGVPMEKIVQRCPGLFRENGVTSVYSGPLWPEGIEGLAAMLLSQLRRDGVSPELSQSVFSVFIEQMNNMLMHCARGGSGAAGGQPDAKGTFLLGAAGKGYLLQTGNMVNNWDIAPIREKIDRLNAMDSEGLHAFYRERMRSRNDNPGSKGAGLGLIEIARRASSGIEYTFQECGEGVSFFEMCMTVGEN